MGKQLFPKEIIQNSAESNFSKHSVRTKLIYLTVLGALVICLVALPLIHINVSVRSQGVITSLTDRNQLISLVSGKINELYIDENSSVVRGQVVATISAPLLQEQSQFNTERQQRLRHYLADLSVLLNIKASNFYEASESGGNRSGTPAASTQFGRQIHQGVQKINQARREIDQGLSIENNADEQQALKIAREELWTLLNTNLPTSEQADSGSQSLQLLIGDSMKKVEEARKTLERHQLLYESNIVTEATLEQSQANLRIAWNQLLAILDKHAAPNTNEASIADEDTPFTFPTINLTTPKYQSALLRFKQEARTAIQQMMLNQQKFDRHQKLFELNMVSEATYQKSKFDLQNARNQFELLFDQQQNSWRTEQIAYEEELKKLMTEYQKIQRKNENYVIRAPVSGSIQSMNGLYEGSFISANQPLAVISPDTALIAECYVPPQNIGLLREGMKVRFQVTTFNYNQWGLLTGTVEEISNDVTIVNNQPVFKVRSSLDKTWLELKNGYRGNLKKGMTVQARFQITKRSLFQLLYDNLDDWLNPKWDGTNAQAQALN